MQLININIWIENYSSLLLLSYKNENYKSLDHAQLNFVSEYKIFWIYELL